MPVMSSPIEAPNAQRTNKQFSIVNTLLKRHHLLLEEAYSYVHMTERIIWPGVDDSVHHTTTTDQDVSDGTGMWSVKKHP
jgi:hypothetical protein